MTFESFEPDSEPRWVRILKSLRSKSILFLNGIEQNVKTVLFKFKLS